jgi:predicted RNA-binding Zn-ribbon protein involved in translation (DUF1610 family)
MFKCQNCGHVTEVSDDCHELKFAAYHDGICKVVCPGCGSYTLSRAYTLYFMAGEFLVVKAHIKRRNYFNGQV